MTDLTTFTPAGRHVSAGGRDFHIRPLKIGKLHGFLTHLMPTAGLLLAGDFTNAYLKDYPGLRAGIAIGAGVEESWLDDLDAEDFLDLSAAVILENVELFLQRVPPKMEQVGKAVMDMTSRLAGDASSRS